MNVGSIREIGSEFYLHEEDLSAQNVGDVSHTFGGRDIVFSRSGRDAIGFVLDNIVPISRTALLPAYSCISMVEPFICRGYRVRYYRLSSRLTPDLEDLRKAFKENPDVMLYMDWFGFPVNGDAVRLARSLSNRVILLEDRTHILFSEGDEGSESETDYAVASLRKWFGTPDGAIALAMKKTFENKPETKANTFTFLRREALLIKGRYMENPSPEEKEHFRSLFSEAESSLDGGLTVIGMSSISLALLCRLDKQKIIKERRANYGLLENCLSGIKGIKPLCGTLSESACPFSYPILVDGDRDFVQRCLAEKGIYCPVLWPLSVEASNACVESAKLSASMLSIPCDQRYGPEDMQYVADAVRQLSR